MLHLLTCMTAWSETKLSPSQGLTGAALAQGRSVLTIPSVASEAECMALLAAGLRGAESQRQSFRARTAAKFAEITSNNPQSDGRVRVPIRSLPPRSEALFDDLLGRVFSIIDEELPSVSALFDGAYDEGDRAAAARLDDSGGLPAVAPPRLTSLSELHASDGLEYSSREPAINVYTAKGELPEPTPAVPPAPRPRTQCQSLTLPCAVLQASSTHTRTGRH